MKPLPLEEIRLNPRSHLSALWWLGLLYRRPRIFFNSFEELGDYVRLVVAAQLYCHAVPWMFAATFLFRFFIFCILTATDDSPRVGFNKWHLLNSSGTAVEFIFGIIYAFVILIIFIVVLQGVLATITLILLFAGKESPILSKIKSFLEDSTDYSELLFFKRFMLYWDMQYSFIITLFKRSSLFIPPILIVIIGSGIAFEIADLVSNSNLYVTVLSIFMGIILGVAFGISLGYFQMQPVDVSEMELLCVVIWLLFSTPMIIVISIMLGFINGLSYIGIGFLFFHIGYMRSYYLFPNLLITFLKIHGGMYPYHPIAWDDLCISSFSRLDRLLLAYAEYAPASANDEIERLISNYPSQRKNALRAHITLLARKAAQEFDLTQLPCILKRLPEGDAGFLAETPRIREMVDEIALLQTRLDTIDRPLFREPAAESLCARIIQFRDQVGGFHEPLASEFRAAAQSWLAVAQGQLDQIRTVVHKEATPQVFRAGDPVDRASEAFVPRSTVYGELERQIMLSSGCPGLLLYGRRRVGKSTVLRNISGFIPPSVHIATISMQNPKAFASLRTWIESIADAIENAGAYSAGNAETPGDLTGLFEFLSSCDGVLKEKGERLLFAIDEFENMDVKIGEGVFPEDLLATLRESMQTHRNVTWVLTGSHAVDELKHAPWTSYLVSARTVEVPLFTEAETRMLLTEPLRHSTVWTKDDPRRPRLSSAFWGDGGIERIHSEAGGWPHLVQSIAEAALDTLNYSESNEIDGALLEEALDKSIVRGDTVLRELLERECTLPGEWDYLRGFRAHDTQAPPSDEAIYRSLRRRLLVCEESGQWRLRVPLMQRWLRERG